MGVDHVRMPVEPMLAQPVDDFHLSAGWAVEPKWDGFRALLAYDYARTRCYCARATAPTSPPASPNWSVHRSERAQAAATACMSPRSMRPSERCVERGR